MKRAFLVLAALAGCSGGTMPIAVAAPVVQLKPADAERALRLQVDRLRLAAGQSFAALWLATTPKFRNAAGILTPSDYNEASLWTDFFAHAQRHHVVQGNTALVGWRDPLTDVWVLSRWTRDGAGWAADRITLSLTQDLGPASPGASAPLRPVFPGQGAVGLAGALATGQFQALRAFRAAAANPNAIGWQVNDRRAIRAREVALLRLRAARNSREGMHQVIPEADRLLRAALIEETPTEPGVSPEVAARLRALSVDTRLSLQPIQYLPSAGKVLAVAQSVFEPSQIFVAHLVPAGVGGIARVESVDAVDLDKVE